MGKKKRRQRVVHLLWVYDDVSLLSESGKRMLKSLCTIIAKTDLNQSKSTFTLWMKSVWLGFLKRSFHFTPFIARSFHFFSECAFFEILKVKNNFFFLCKWTIYCLKKKRNVQIFYLWYWISDYIVKMLFSVSLQILKCVFELINFN